MAVLPKNFSLLPLLLEIRSELDAADDSKDTDNWADINDWADTGDWAYTGDWADKDDWTYTNGNWTDEWTG